MQTQQEMQPMLDTPNPVANNNETEISPEAMQHLQVIRVMRFCVFLSAIVRIIFNSVVFEPISFAITIVISLTGIIAGIKKNPQLLAVYGIISIIQAIIGAVIFVTILLTSAGAYFPMWALLFFIFTVTIVALGGVKAIKLKYKILEYQQLYGPLPPCLGKVCRFAARPVAEETTQETEPVANSDFVMIPMNQFPQQVQVQQPVQQVPQSIALNQQPVVYQQQGAQQPVFFTQQPQFMQVPQPMPMMYAFPPQQNGNMFPQNVQYAPQPAFIQQPVFTQAPPNNGYSN